MTGLFFTSDLHFGHQRVSDLRGFSTVKQHDAVLIRNWNATVRPDDTVWCLGDFVGDGRTDPEPYVSQLHGRIHLITGNHDAPWPGNRNAHRHQKAWLWAGFESVQAFARIRVHGRRVHLSHFPYAFAGDHTATERHTQHRLLDMGDWLLHGHVHDAWRLRKRMLNVGVDVHGFTPVSVDRVHQLLGEAEDLEVVAALGTATP